MSILSVEKYPSPILKQKAKDVVQFDASLRQFIDDMKDTMVAYEGVGLAAPQVSRSIRLFVASPSGKKADVLVFINPEIMPSSQQEWGQEGCLSVPGVTAEVERAKKLTISFLDIEGNHHREEAQGFLARIIQHENDHLLGKVFIDHLGFTERRKVLENYKQREHISM